MSDRLEPLFGATSLPVLQNRLYENRREALACPVGDVELRHDRRTGIVTNSRFDPTKIVYDRNYSNEQALSDAFLRHLDEVSRLVLETMEGDDLVEIGCGKGTFLGALRDRGVRVRGFDPAFEGDDPLVEARLFGADDQFRADGIVLRHVLEHIPNPLGFLRMIRDANEGKGRIYIEVPCFNWILEHGAWFDVFYEHVNYFRESDFRRVFGEVVRVERSFRGQYLSVVAELGSLVDDTCITWKGEEVNPDQCRSLSTSMAASIEAVKSLMWRRKGETLALWGGASKGVIFSLGLQRAGVSVDAVVDINPAKQGKHLPCSGIQVMSPDEFLSNLIGTPVVIVMNPNYIGEIRDMTGSTVELIGA